MSHISIEFNNGILYCHKQGRLDGADGVRYEEAVNAYATASLVPIVVLFDARQLSLITPDASRAFVRASKIQNVKCVIFAAHDFVVTQSVRVLAIRDHNHNTHIFEDWQMATRFAQEQAGGQRRAQMA